MLPTGDAVSGDSVVDASVAIILLIDAGAAGAVKAKTRCVAERVLRSKAREPDINLKMISL